MNLKNQTKNKFYLFLLVELCVLEGRKCFVSSRHVNFVPLMLNQYLNRKHNTKILRKITLQLILNRSLFNWVFFKAFLVSQIHSKVKLIKNLFLPCQSGINLDKNESKLYLKLNQKIYWIKDDQIKTSLREICLENTFRIDRGQS